MKKIFLLVFSILALTYSLALAPYCLAQANSAKEIKPLVVGASLPFADVSTIESKKINLKDEIKGKPSLLIFYRGGWCPYCNLQLGELQKIEADLRALGVSIVAISPDSPEHLKKSMKEKTLSYKLYSDNRMNAAKAFGIAFKVDEKMFKDLLGYGVDIEKSSGFNHRLLPVPAAFLIDKEGVIRFQYANPDYKVRVSTEELIAAAKELGNK